MNSDTPHIPDKTSAIPPLTLVLMAGLPGTGKTTLALALGQRLRWPVIDKDSLKSPLLSIGIQNEFAGPASYVLMLEIAHDLLVQQRLSVILDSPARYPSVLERVRALTCSVKAHLKIIYCMAHQEIRNQRIRSRVARPSQWNIDTDTQLTNEQERQMFAHLPADTLVLDTQHTFEECIVEGLAYLQR